MKLWKMLITILLFLMLSACFPTTQTPTPIFASSADYVKAAWDAYNKKEYQTAIGFAEECIKKWEKDALDQQNKILEAPPIGKVNDQEMDAILENWAVNDVATAYFIIGESYSKIGQTAEAKAAYTKTQSFSNARCWDEGGWFWSPAEEAKKR